MSRKYKNKYRIDSTRLKHWNYGWKGFYFITICTKNRGHYFGQIKNGKMILSEIGKIVKTEWLKTPMIRPDMNIVLDEFIIMPDHFHAIIYIGKNRYNSNRSRDAMHGVSTPTHGQTYKNQPGPQQKNLASVVRGFKSAVTKSSRLINPDFQWQSRYYDVIVRNKKSLYLIRNYIIRNPLNWIYEIN